MFMRRLFMLYVNYGIPIKFAHISYFILLYNTINSPQNESIPSIRKSWH
jgi:hypothetical protein